MQIAVDLHSHSGYAGGVGDISLKDICRSMSYKGIKVFGTGDCILPQRSKELQEELKYSDRGLYRLNKEDNELFLLQTEIILTLSLPEYKNKIVAHHVLLIPDFSVVEKIQLLMNKWKQKNTIGRPFIVNSCLSELEDRLFELQATDKYLEIIPAHIMTPDGLMGSKNMLREMKEFYGDFTPNIHALETGLSSDPLMLSKLSGMNELAMISSSDCHSAALNRIGREFTVLESEDLSYTGIIEAIRGRKIVMTAEFDPREGRYYYSGHRAGKGIHEEHVLFRDDVPEDYICPVCGKKLTVGVYDRCKQLAQSKASRVQDFIHLIPLIDVTAYGMGIKSSANKKVTEEYFKMIDIFDTEINLWRSEIKEIRSRLDGKVKSQVINKIIAVKEKRFTYEPAGFDGLYGNLIIEDKLI